MLKDLILHLKELEVFSSKCSKCGMCQSVCPVFLKTGHETDVARGKLTLIDGLVTDILEQPEVVLNRLNKCLLCGSCNANCSRGVNTVEIFIRARVIITEYSGLSFFKKIILRKIISNPLVFNRAASLLQRYQKLFLQSSKTKNGSLSARFYVPYIKGRNLQPIAPVSFHSLRKNKNKDGGSPSSDLLFFSGCLIDKIMPETGTACLNALAFHGYKPSLAEGEVCCGMPAIASGDLVSFNRLVEQNTELFLAVAPRHIVTACATCTFAIKELWPLLYKGHLQQQVADMASRTIDISQFIIENSNCVGDDIPGGKGKVNSITIHDPCHLKKSLGVYKEPRILLNSIPDASIKEMKDSDSCCGFGGTFNLSHYDLSSDIGGDKCLNIIDSGASTVATGCPACMMQLKDLLCKKNSNIMVRHFMEIYADSLPENFD